MFIISMFGYKNLTIDTSLNSLLNKGDASKVIYDKFVDEFGSDDTTLIYIKDTNLFTYEKISKLEELVYTLEELEFVEKIDSLFSVKNIKNVDGFIESSKLIDETPEDEKELLNIKKDALSNPIVKNNLLSADGSVTTINLSIAKINDSKFTTEVIYAEIEKLISPLEADFGEIFQIGSHRVSKEMKYALYNDIIFLGSFSMLTLLLLLLLFLRTKVAVIIPLTTSLLSIIITFGVMGLLGVKINILSAMLPTMIIVLGSTEDTHMISAFLNYIQTSAKESKDIIIKKMLKKTGIALLLTTITTVLGFASNIFSGIDLIKDFAITATFALGINGLITILLVPVFLHYFDFSSYNSSNSFAKYTNSIMKILTTVYAKHKKLVSLITLTLVALSIFLAKDLQVNNDPLSYFHSQHQLVLDSHKLHDNLAGMQTFYISFEGSQRNFFKEPKNLRLLEQTKKYIVSNKTFDSAISFTDHMSLVNREMHDGKEKFYSVPETSNLVDQYLLFFQRGDIEKYINSSFSSANIVVRHNISNSQELNAAIKTLNTYLYSNFDTTNINIQITSENILINKAADDLLIGQLQSLSLLILIVFIIMSLLFTSLKAGLVSLLPNTIPIIMTFGTMQLLNIPINPGTIMVAVIAFGIALDDTIHLMTHYNSEARKTSDNTLAINITVKSQLVPVITTSISLAIGFIVLSSSSFTVVSQFGLVAAIAMMYAMISDLLVTPIIINKVRLVNIWDLLSLNIKDELVKTCVLFNNMKNFEIKQVILLSRVKKLYQGEVLIQENDYGNSMYIILKGSVDVFKDEKKIATLSTGEVVGEVGFIKNIKRTATVIANEDIEVLSLNSDDIKNSIRSYPKTSAKLNHNISIILGTRLADTLNKKVY
ncbi:MMPL family transporter [Sulfurimonas sp.]|nr:MMPL family transporter [Sulfurimonas sp.]